MTGLLLFFSPAPLLILYAWLKARLSRRRNAGETAVEPKHYEPAVEATPGFLLRRFNSGERTYLRDQWLITRVGFCIVAWFFLTMMGSSLLPTYVNGTNIFSHIVLPATQPLARRVWFSFVYQSGLLVNAGAIIGIMTAVAIGIGFTTTPAANLSRTRPISYRLRFWGRTLPAFAALISGWAVGVGLAFALMLAFYGPVWRHLEIPPTPAGVTSGSVQSTPIRSVKLGTSEPLPITDEDSPHYDDPDVQQARHLYWYRHSSPPRAFLSVLTTCLLCCAIPLCLMCKPFGGGSKKGKRPLWLFLVLPFGVFLWEALFLSHLKTFLFMYGFGSRPDVPPWPFVLVPIAIVATLLPLSEFFYARAEF